MLTRKACSSKQGSRVDGSPDGRLGQRPRRETRDEPCREASVRPGGASILWKLKWELMEEKGF